MVQKTAPPSGFACCRIVHPQTPCIHSRRDSMIIVAIAENATSRPWCRGVFKWGDSFSVNSGKNVRSPPFLRSQLYHRADGVARSSRVVDFRRHVERFAARDQPRKQKWRQKAREDVPLRRASATGLQSDSLPAT